MAQLLLRGNLGRWTWRGLRSLTWWAGSPGRRRRPARAAGLGDAGPCGEPGPDDAGRYELVGAARPGDRPAVVVDPARSTRPTCGGRRARAGRRHTDHPRAPRPHREGLARLSRSSPAPGLVEATDTGARAAASAPAGHARAHQRLGLLRGRVRRRARGAHRRHDPRPGHHGRGPPRRRPRRLLTSLRRLIDVRPDPRAARARPGAGRLRRRRPRSTWRTAGPPRPDPAAPPAAGPPRSGHGYADVDGPALRRTSTGTRWRGRVAYRAQIGSYREGPENDVTCPVCGTVTVPGARFCHNCGAALPAAATSARRRASGRHRALRRPVRLHRLVRGRRPGAGRCGHRPGAGRPRRRGARPSAGTSTSSPATASWPSSARRWPTRTTPSGPSGPPWRCSGRCAGCSTTSAAAAPSGLRVGINTGEVVAGVQAALEYTVIGDTVNTAARLADAAAVGRDLRRRRDLRRDPARGRPGGAAALRLKGKREPVEAYELLGLLDAPGTRSGSATRAVRRPRVGAGLVASRLAEAVDQGEPRCWCSPPRPGSARPASPEAAGRGRVRPAPAFGGARAAGGPLRRLWRAVAAGPWPTWSRPPSACRPAGDARPGRSPRNGCAAWPADGAAAYRQPPARRPTSCSPCWATPTRPATPRRPGSPRHRDTASRGERRGRRRPAAVAELLSALATEAPWS